MKKTFKTLIYSMIFFCIIVLPAIQVHADADEGLLDNGDAYAGSGRKREGVSGDISENHMGWRIYIVKGSDTSMDQLLYGPVDALVNGDFEDVLDCDHRGSNTRFPTIKWDGQSFKPWISGMPNPYYTNGSNTINGWAKKKNSAGTFNAEVLIVSY